MKRVVSLLFSSIIFSQVFSQNVAINNDGSQPNAGAILDIKSNNKGLLIPRVNLTSETDVSTIPSPVNSLLVFNTNAALPDGVGFYFWNGNNTWSKLATVNATNNSFWGIAGNSGINPSTDFIGTTGDQPLIFKTNSILSGKIDQGVNSVFFGQHAGESITTGENNSFFGHQAGASNSIGEANTAIGSQALLNNIDGDKNVAVGYNGLLSNVSGSRNVTIGNSALKANISGSDNVANGFQALFSNNIGSNNFAAGTASLYSNSTGSNNIAIGDSALFYNFAYNNIAIGHAALYSNTGGLFNTGVGSGALYSNSTGYSNTAIGYNALNKNTSAFNSAFGAVALLDNTAGSSNDAFGHGALHDNTTGSSNDAFGRYALFQNTNGDGNAAFGNFALQGNTSGYHNTACGKSALLVNRTGNNNTAIGTDSGPASSGLGNTTALGYDASVTTSNTMVFGNNSIDRWAFGLTTTNANHAITVGTSFGNGNGAYLTQGGTWTNASSRIKKEDFTDVNSNDLLQKISQLSIQKWKYKGTDEYHIGPVAEDFYAAFGLGTDEQGISTVDPVGIALAAIKEQQKKIEWLEKQNDDLKKEIKTIHELILQKK